MDNRNNNVFILEWLTTHPHFTYNEIFELLTNMGYTTKKAEEKIYAILETSQIKRIGKYYIFTQR